MKTGKFTVSTIRISVKELISEGKNYELEHETIFRLLKQKGMPCIGEVRPIPDVEYEYYKCNKTGDLVFSWVTFVENTNVKS